jgi:hypothetical protein
LYVFLNFHFVGKEMAKEIIHGERLYLGGDRGDEGVIFWTQTGKKIRSEFEIIEWPFCCSKSGGNLLDPLEVSDDGGAALVGSGKFVVETQHPGSCGGSERLG